MKNILNNISEILSKFNFILNRKQKERSLILLFVILVGAGFETIGVSAILPFVQAMMEPEKLMQNSAVQKIAIQIGIQSSAELIGFVGIGVILIYLIKNLYLSLSAYLQVKFQCKIEEELSVHLLFSYMKRPYVDFLNTNSSEIMRNVEGDVGGLYFMLGACFKIVTEGLTALLIGCFIFSQDPIMALGIVALAISCFIGTTYGFKNILKKNGKASRKYAILKYRHIYQAANGIKEIKVMNRGEFFTQNYKLATEKFQKTKLVQGFLGMLPEKIIEAVCVCGLVGIVCIRVVNGGEATQYVAQLASFAVAAFRILPSISRITSGFNDFVFNKPSLDAMYQNLKEVKEYEKKVSNVKGDETQIIEKITRSFERRVEVKDVAWNYPNSDKQILKNFNITIEKGESIAFIGASGAGKTTAADIILGLLHPKQGNVTMDGMDIFKMGIHWSKIVGYVPQSVFMTDDTIRNNIAFGMPQDEIDDILIWNALEQAQLKEFVEKLPKSLDTEIGERGIRFSGGQKQRVAIARALYYNPDILVLDEATAALDNETEEALMESIEALQGKKTLIIVAHRLTTIKKCNKIYEIIEGQAVLQQ